MKKRILSIIMAICLLLSCVPITVFADGDSHTVTVNAGEGGKVSTDGTSWNDSVSVKVNDGETLDGKVQYKADEGYAFDGVVPKIVSVAAGSVHTVLLDAKGNVWTAGSNAYGQLGRKTSSDSDSTFTQVTVGDGVKIKAIAAGGYHTVLLDEDGNVWTAGRNNYGQLGRDTSPNYYDQTFTKVTDGISGVKIKSISAGFEHTVLLDEKGNVWTAGSNLYGRLGRDTSSYKDSTFTQVKVGDDVDSVKIKAIAAGREHTVLLDEKGNVWTAGSNGQGQLGTETDSTINSTFMQVTNGIVITAIAAGDYHTVLLDEDNNVWTAGRNDNGQLGITGGSTLTFTQVTDGISGVKITAIAAGGDHTILLDEDGNVWTAGRNDSGQLGRTDSNTSTFTQVTNGISGVKITAIAAGSFHTVLLDAKGNVWTAGLNYYGQLGRDENKGINVANPTFAQPTVNPDAITFDEFVNIPIKFNSVFLVKFKVKHTVTVNAGEGGKVSTDGTSWADSVSVYVDDGETLNGKVQYKADEGYAFDGVISPSNIVSAAGGSFHTVLLDAKGNVWTAGLNDCDQLGRETSSDNDSTFKQVTVGDGVKIKAIAAGDNHTVLLDEKGNVWTAGSNGYGQLGRDGDISSFTQVKVGDDVKIKAIAAGEQHTVLLGEDGNVWTAGSNYYGQLGRDENKGAFISNSTFKQVTDGISGVKIKAISASSNHTVLLDESNNVWAAGRNNYGQLGKTANNNPNPTFTQVTDGINGVKITAIAAGSFHTVLLDESNNVWTAGDNYYGQLGRETSTDRDSTFTKVSDSIGGVNITAIAAGESHTVLLDEDGTVWTDGLNDCGQLGRNENVGTYTANPIFKQVTVGNGVKIKAMAAGAYHTVLLDEKGNVWTAGYNYYGQLGRKTSSDKDSTFAQPTVNPDAITFDELINIPIHNNSVFLVKFKDIQKPVITGLENGKTYCDNVEFTVSDNDGIASVKANDVELTATNGKYTLAKGKGTVTVVATDKAGNETSVTVTVNNGHTYEWQSENSQYWQKCKYCGYETAKKDIPTITIDAPDTVCRTQDCEATALLSDGISDAALTYEFIGLGGAIDTTVEDGKLYAVVTADSYPDIENSFNLVVYATTNDGFSFDVSKTVQIQNEHAGGIATCTAKAICDTCGESYGELDSTNHNLEKISAKDATVTETGNKDYWHCLDCDKYFADENCTNEIKLDDTVTAKLPPEIIEGKGQSITAGEKKELTFRSNALFGDFIRFELDGETVDSMNYVVKEGSTIVALNADYVATLSAGEHTIGIVSASGTATATFTINTKAIVNNDTKSPETGNDINTAILLTLILSCGGVIIVTGAYGKRKKHSR